MGEFLHWQSGLALEKVFSQGEAYAYPTPVDQGILYLTSIKQEQSRQALMIFDGEQSRCITPADFNLRTKINEYGGKPFWLIGQDIYFANAVDQCLYRQSLRDLEALPQKITQHRSPNTLMFAELAQLDDRYLLSIAETELEGRENLSAIVIIDLQEVPCAPQELISGADFYNNLVVDAKRQQIAWVEWSHPNMPWDANELFIASFAITTAGIQLDSRQQLDTGTGASHCQCFFASNGKLFFSADYSNHAVHSAQNYWNIYAYDPHVDLKAVQPVTQESLEFGYPHWQFGDARICQIDEHRLLAVASGAEGDFLFKIDIESQHAECLTEVAGHMQNLASDEAGRVAAVLLSNDQSAQIVELDTQAIGFKSRLTNVQALPESDISHARHIAYTTRDKHQAYGFYYPPRNSKYKVEGMPPLLVMVHGGPTARAYGFFDIQKQFWTNRGFAILDVNHRGSSGYGREYRDALYEQWGELDAGDIVDGVQYLVSQGLADANKVCIRGKSAGGYAVLRALTAYPEVFVAGACYYGIGNLATLAEITHKFEKHYTDRLLGEAYNAEQAKQPTSLYFMRSPINYIQQVESAMIIFQGLQDNVVPPALAEEVVEQLNDSGVFHEYYEYADEGHGFRQVGNNIHAWTQELNFYRKVLSNDAG